MPDPFIGEIKIFAGNFAPRNWAFCNGDLVAISQNTALFSLLGTTYGGDGRTTFALPNLEGRAPMHAGEGTGPGLTHRQLGQTGGATTTHLTVTQMPRHNHPVLGSSNATSAGPSSNLGVGAARMYSATGTAVAMAGEKIENTGGGAPHNNRQPLLGLNFIIALQGIFPSRS